MGNLWEMMGCEECGYRAKTYKGCYKFGLSKEEINAGARITTLKCGEYTMSMQQYCPHAAKKEKKEVT